MNKVVSVNLGGNAYQLEESAYDALREYVAGAERALAGNPDKEEIINDLEQAIGNKCDAFLSAHKTVVLLADIKAVLAEMGPVDSSGEGAGKEGAAGSSRAGEPYKRLYQIREGSVIAGVCTGLAAYFNVDVTLVRVLFVLFAIFTHGFGIVLYILMMILVPHARTAKEYEQAAGVPPVTAQALMDRAKDSYDHVVKQSADWHTWGKQFKEQGRAWKHQHNAWRRAAQKAHRKGQKLAYRYSGEYRHRQSFLSELNEFIWSMFGLVVVIFCIWFVYHHVPLVTQFFDSVKALWDHSMYALYQFIENNN